MSYMNTISDIKESVVPNTPADALVFFGATGDLAHKKIFPALQSLAKRGNLDIPVIVAKAGWTLDQLKSPAQDSVERYGGLDPDAFSRLSRRMDYIDGDYADPATFQELRRKLGNAKQPTHYLAIPPSLFETVIRRLGESGCAEGARIVIENLSDRPCHSEDTARRFQGRKRFSHRPLPGQKRGSKPALFPLCQFFSRAPLESAVRQKRADHDGGKLRCRGSRQFLRPHGRTPRRRAESSAASSDQHCDGASARAGCRDVAARKSQGVERNSPARAASCSARSVSRLSRRARRQARLSDGNLCSVAA